ncbi:Fur family transcriptional regulator [Streptomyces nigrescens]
MHPTGPPPPLRYMQMKTILVYSAWLTHVAVGRDRRCALHEPASRWLAVRPSRRHAVLVHRVRNQRTAAEVRLRARRDPRLTLSQGIDCRATSPERRTCVELPVERPSEGEEMAKEQVVAPSRQLHARRSADQADGRRPSPRSTWQREAVLRALEELDAFASAQELHRLLRGQGNRVSLTTVYRTIAILERLDLVDVVRDDKGERSYRRRDAPEHQHYLVCRQCGHSVPVPSEAFETWLTAVQQAHGFTEVQHMLDLVGLCRECWTGEQTDSHSSEPRHA